MVNLVVIPTEKKGIGPTFDLWQGSAAGGGCHQALWVQAF